MARASRIATAGFLSVLAAVLLAANSDRLIRPYIQGGLASSPGELEPQWWGLLVVAAVVAAAGPAVARFGAKAATLAALAMLALAHGLCGVAPSAGWYLVGRHLQFASAAIALIGLLSWALAGFEPRRWGLFLGAFYLIVWSAVSMAGGFAQMYAVDSFSWRIVMFGAAAIIAAAAIAAIWLPGPEPETDPATRISGVFGADQPVTARGGPRRWRAPLVFAAGLVAAVLLTRLVNQIVLVDPQTLDEKVRLKLLPVYAQVLAFVAVAVFTLRLRPGWIGAVCCGLLLLGCTALATGLADLDRLNPPITLCAAQAIAVAAQFALALATLRAGRPRLEVPAALVVTAVLLVWGLWDLMVTAKLIDEPISRDRFIAMGLAALGMLAGMAAARDKG